MSDEHREVAATAPTLTPEQHVEVIRAWREVLEELAEDDRGRRLRFALARQMLDGAKVGLRARRIQGCARPIPGDVVRAGAVFPRSASSSAP
jgi:hypothetical protein